MKIFKKNQIIITALALMIAAAGYVSYTYGNEDDLAAATSQEVTEDTYEISEEDALLEDDIFTDPNFPFLLQRRLSDGWNPAPPPFPRYPLT